MKKYLLTAAFLIATAAGAFAVYSQKECGGCPAETACTECEGCQAGCDACPGCQASCADCGGCAGACPSGNCAAVCESETIIAVVETPDGEVVPESGIAKKMTQAEKAENARVNDSWGGAITILAMSIVVSALAILSILFFCFGKVSQSLLSRNKRNANAHAAAAAAAAGVEHPDVDSGEVIAAISMALHDHFGGDHDIEETILTIRKLKKSYSPWSSKIYNLRTMPDHRRNLPG